MNLSPVFGLYPDEAGEVQERSTRPSAGRCRSRRPITSGTVSRLWPVTDQHVISRVTGLLGPKPVFIADGHHRYETGLRYLDERRAAGEVPNDEPPANFTLMMLVGMSDPGLVILPTHRLVSGLPPMTAEKLREAARRLFHGRDGRHGRRGGPRSWERSRPTARRPCSASAPSPTAAGRSPG